MIGEAMRRLLDALDGTGVQGFGVAHSNGTAQLTLKGDPQTTESLLDRFFDAIIVDLEEEG